MKNLPGQQKGASAIFTVIILAVLAYGVFVGIQYAPQLIESKAIDSIFRTMEGSQDTDPVTSEYAARVKISSLLHINQMDEMSKSLSVRGFDGEITIEFSYDRELDLGYKKQLMHYEKILILN